MEIKPFKDYHQLLEQLLQKGMIIPDHERAVRKISQVGYYRLGSFWYPCRTPSSLPAVTPRCKSFLPDTNFDEIFKLYLFDKRLRLLLLDAIERIEVNLKTKISHELGKYSSLAYIEHKYINPKQLKDYQYNGIKRNTWDEWFRRQQNEIDRCKEDFIQKYKINNEPIPIWVAVETWSFGTLSKYFEMLKGSHQNHIAKQLGVDNASYLARWLQAISVLRNRCAHHTRVWNQSERNPLKPPPNLDAFGVFDEYDRKRIFVLILIIAHLVKHIGPNSDWLERVLDVLADLPNLPIDIKKAMAIKWPTENLL